MKPIVLLMTGVLLASTAMVALPASAASPEEIITMRKANQKRVSDLFGNVKKALDAGATAGSQVEAVKEIDDRTHLIKGYFPPGTETGGGTKAGPAIWTNRAGFDAAADTYVAAFDKLLTLAQANDTPGFTAQFAAAGATCGACHRNFRER